jgi:DNA polymerase I
MSPHDNTDKRLFLLDAFALIYRAYFAFSKNPLYNSKGMNTSAIQGFTNTLLDILTKQNPSHIAVCFDTAAPTTRHEEFADYKAQREAQPEDITISIPYIRQIIEAFNIPIVEKDGFEADDVIGTLAKQAEKAGYTVYMVTPDKDFGQLVSDNIFMFKPPFLGNTYEILGTEEIKKRWEIDDVKKVIDILGLMGDASDNIPGLPGVGEKTAKKFVAEFGSVENLIKNTDKLKGKQQQTVIDNKDIALLSKKLATIITDVPVKFHEENFCRSEMDKQKLGEIFADLEFRTLGKRLLGSDFAVTSASKGQTDLFGKEALPRAIEKAEEEVEKPTESDNEAPITAGFNIDNTPHTYYLVDTPGKIKDLVSTLSKSKFFCFDTETTNVDANLAEIVGFSAAIKPHEGYYVPFPADQKKAMELINHFKPLLEDEHILKIGQNMKYDMLLLKWYDVDVRGTMFDTMIAHYLIDADMRHNMDIMAETYLNYSPVSIETLIGKKGKQQGNMRDVDFEKIKEYAAEDADITLQLKEHFVPMLKEKKAEKLFNDVEMPLVSVLTDMEFEGVKVDEKFLNDYSVLLEKDIVKAEKEVQELAGVKFNLASPKQLGEVLFEKLKIPYVGQKTKTGQYSTDEDTLSKLETDTPIISKLLDYRELTKLKSTYVDALPLLVNPKTGRVHTTFAQAVAATGRLSSNNPNLQNIPIRTERGREIRKAFIARDDKHVLLSADYSQIELRIIASLSGDENMMSALKHGQDIHSATAAKVFGVPLNEVTREMRSKAKAVNFGIAYGQTAFGLSQSLRISRNEAKEIIDNYNKQFPGVARLMEDNRVFAREHGYIETMLGRRRYLRDINSRNANVRNFAERIAINAPIQGSAADMIKVAMININNELRKHKFKSKMTLQVHDELVFDVHKSEIDKIKELVHEKMTHAIELSVPIEVETGIGSNWLEAH